MRTWSVRGTLGAGVLAAGAMTLVAATAAAQPAAAPAPCTPTAADTCSAQPTDTTETNRGPIIPFLEGTDVFWTLQSGSSWLERFPHRLEADIFPHLVAYQNFTDILDVTKQGDKGVDKLKEFAISISGTPAVRIRMLRETSAPVRTPSFMPRVNIQLLWARGLKAAATAARNTPAAISRQELRTQRATPDTGRARQEQVLDALAHLEHVSLWEAHAIVGHHSNGQDGCLSTLQTRDPETEECLPRGAPLLDDTVNRIDGSFSTNYIRTGINYSRNRMRGASTEDAEAFEADRELRVKAEFEYHPRPWVDEDIVDIYGRARVNLSGAYAVKSVSVCRRRLEVSAGVVWNPGVVDSVPELSSTTQVSCFPWPNGGWGFFTRFYNGQDYYNVGFLDDVRRLHVGVTFNQTGFFRFRRPDRRPSTQP